MENQVFGEVVFNMGWESHLEIVLFDNHYCITVSAASYFETDEINKNQEDAYAEFISNKEEWLSKIEKTIIDFNDKASKKYTPSLLKVKKDGSMALVFDDLQDNEEGIVVCFKPEIEIMTCDQYF